MFKKYEIILLIGPPASGKGTQGKLLAAEKEYVHFSTGEMFRNIDFNTKIGQKIKRLLDNGELVPDSLVFELFDQNIEYNQAIELYNLERDYLLLDGIPRNLAQVPLINEIAEIKQIFEFYCDDESILIQRMLNRGKIEGRSDDQNIDVSKKRLEVYKNQTLPVLEQYDPALIARIDASKTIEEINKDVLEVILKRESKSILERLYSWL